MNRSGMRSSCVSGRSSWTGVWSLVAICVSSELKIEN
jgi:hypothetical protein